MQPASAAAITSWAIGMRSRAPGRIWGVVMQPLKLVALDADDLEVMSAHLQDAVMLVRDMAYVPAQKRFAVITNRFDWENAIKNEAGADKQPYQRRRSALRFDRVLGTQLKGLRQSAASAVVELLAIRFEPAEEPEGHITLLFAGGGAIRLHVECIEAELRDLGPAWRAQSKPRHDEDTDERSAS